MSKTYHQFDVGQTFDIQLPPEYDQPTMDLDGVLRKPDGSLLLVSLLVQGTTVKSARYTSAPMDLDQLGTYSFSVTMKIKSSLAQRALEPLFFRVWPRGRQGTS